MAKNHRSLDLYEILSKRRAQGKPVLPPTPPPFAHLRSNPDDDGQAPDAAGGNVAAAPPAPGTIPAAYGSGGRPLAPQVAARAARAVNAMRPDAPVESAGWPAGAHGVAAGSGIGGIPGAVPISFRKESGDDPDAADAGTDITSPGANPPAESGYASAAANLPAPALSSSPAAMSAQGAGTGMGAGAGTTGPAAMPGAGLYKARPAPAQGSVLLRPPPTMAQPGPVGPPPRAPQGWSRAVAAETGPAGDYVAAGTDAYRAAEPAPEPVAAVAARAALDARKARARGPHVVVLGLDAALFAALVALSLIACAFVIGHRRGVEEAREEAANAPVGREAPGPTAVTGEFAAAAAPPPERADYVLRLRSARKGPNVADALRLELDLARKQAAERLGRDFDVYLFETDTVYNLAIGGGFKRPDAPELSALRQVFVDMPGWMSDEPYPYQLCETMAVANEPLLGKPVGNP